MNKQTIKNWLKAIVLLPIVIIATITEPFHLSSGEETTLLKEGIRLFCCSETNSEPNKVPEKTGLFVDITDTVTTEQSLMIEQKLQRLNQKTGIELAVFLTETTSHESIETYSLKVAETWALGREGIDDGLLFLVAKADKKARIEVGYGLEGVLTDAISKRILTEVVSPHLASGDFVSSINDGVAQLVNVLEGNQVKESREINTELSSEINTELSSEISTEVSFTEYLLELRDKILLMSLVWLIFFLFLWKLKFKGTDLLLIWTIGGLAILFGAMEIFGSQAGFIAMASLMLVLSPFLPFVIINKLIGGSSSSSSSSGSSSGGGFGGGGASSS
jgi:uncharacterized protein